MDLERELEHKDVLLAHCMKREADEVTPPRGLPATVTRAKGGVLFPTQDRTKATRRFVRRQFGEGVMNADSRIRKFGFRVHLDHV